MAKTVGIPEGFSLNVNTERVEIGDYLDETTAPRPRPRNREPKKEAPIDEVAQPVNPEQVREEVVSRKSEADTSNVVEMPVSKPTAKRKAPKRKQVNMNPKTLERLHDLVSMVQEYSPQSDAAASEIMEAIIQAHFEARDKLNFRGVPERGRWGTPTAQAFKDALAKAFTNSILEYHSE